MIGEPKRHGLLNGHIREQRSIEQKVRTRRLFVIDEAIRTGKYPNTDKLAAVAEVNSRTIQRDIEYLWDMFNAPIEYSAAHRGYYYREPSFYLKSVPLTEGELFSIALFDQLLEQYRNTPLEGDLRKIFRKIVSSLPENVTADAGFPFRADDLHSRPCRHDRGRGIPDGPFRFEDQTGGPL